MFTIYNSVYSFVTGSEQLRLIGGKTNHSGTVEINIAGSWGTICDASFDRLDAVVICRILGYQRP